MPFEPGELSPPHAMLRPRPPQQRREPRPLPNRIEPRIAQHGGITKEPTAHHALKKFQRGIDLVQARQMPRPIKKPLRGAELGTDDAPHPRAALSLISPRPRA